MNPKTFDETFSKVPEDQKERFKAFRQKYPANYLKTSRANWEYFSGGNGKENLVLLPGGVRFGDAWFQLIMKLENDFNIIAPTYPGLETIADLTLDLASLMEKENILKAHILGTSFGGWLAQCFVRRFPEKVEKLILSHTTVPGAIPVSLIALGVKIASLYPTRILQLSAKWNMLQIMSLNNLNRDLWKAFWQEKTQTHLLKFSREEALSLYKASLDFSRNYSFSTEDLMNWPGQLYVIESNDDKAIRAKARKAIRELYPQAQVYTFQNAGHTPGYSNPEEYAKVIENCLKT